MFESVSANTAVGVGVGASSRESGQLDRAAEPGQLDQLAGIWSGPEAEAGVIARQGLCLPASWW